MESLKVTSHNEAGTNLGAVLSFLQSKENNTSNELSKLIFPTQNDSLETNKRQSKVTVLLPNPADVVSLTLLKTFYDYM